MIEIQSDVLQTIGRCFSEFHNASKNPGMQYAISYRGSVIHTGSLGNRIINPLLPRERDSISRIASMTKSFATAAMLRLRDQGLVDIDAPLASIAPRLTLAEPFAGASLRNLMAMKLDLPVDDPWADRVLDAHNHEHEVYFARPMLQAGVGRSTCSYSNLSYILLGRIIREISGRSAMEYISTEILRPLGLRDTVWNISKENRERIARGYRVDSSPHVEERHFTCQSDGVVFGGLWSTVDDLAVWLEFIRGDEASPASWDEVLSKPSRRELWRPYSSYPGQSERSLISGQLTTSKAHYGFGLVTHTILGVDYVSHSGGLPGYGGHMRVHPESGLGIMALGNGTYCRASTPCSFALHHLILFLDPSHQARFTTVVDSGGRVADFALSGEAGEPSDLFTYNVWQDTLPERFAQETRKVCETLGADIQVESIMCISGYQGEVIFVGSGGTRKLVYSLAPVAPARVQSIEWAEA
jgi:CubicO group peptidase (beta-lactamase class C family)